MCTKVFSIFYSRGILLYGAWNCTQLWSTVSLYEMTYENTYQGIFHGRVALLHGAWDFTQQRARKRSWLVVVGDTCIWNVGGAPAIFPGEHTQGPNSQKSAHCSICYSKWRATHCNCNTLQQTAAYSETQFSKYISLLNLLSKMIASLPFRRSYHTRHTRCYLRCPKNTHWNTCCNKLQHTATHTNCHTRHTKCCWRCPLDTHCNTRCNILQNTTTSWSTLYHTLVFILGMRNAADDAHWIRTATHAATLQHTATRCQPLQHTLIVILGVRNAADDAHWMHTATHAATHCNTLQQAGAHCITH